ncbi:LysR family transcriptional regulator [Sutterella sp.]|uniref:LysR family transcriptional regulator n=1 Tax=Sutterella sp. TaxID=1981025 RepID=UPI0026E090E3|nr:LysR family transcriptional regulator [Sutterella sp.]MDO5532365.1 LysR family transcriptional regulator [Sutterella sp.]
MPRIDFRLLRQCHLLLEVITAGSLSRAARNLGLTQPALAEQINLLEQDLGVELLNRTPRGATPTETAKALLPRIQAFAQTAADFTDQASQICAENPQVIRVGCVFEAMLRVMPALRAEVSWKLPAMELHTENLDSSDAEEELLAKHIDLAIGRFDLFGDERIRMKTLLTESPVIAVPADHPLSESKESTLPAFRSEKWVAIDPAVSRNYVKKIEVFLKRNGIRPNVVATAPSIVTQLGIVGCGEGVAIVPESFRSMLPPSVRVVKLRESHPFITLSVAWDSSAECTLRDRALELLMNLQA